MSARLDRFRACSSESTVRKFYAMIASCHLEMGNRQSAKESVEQGLTLTQRDPELLCRAGIVYRELGDLAAAERSFLTLLTAREAVTSFPGFLPAWEGLLELYIRLRRFGDARDVVTKVADFAPDAAEGLAHRLDLLGA